MPISTPRRRPIIVQNLESHTISPNDSDSKGGVNIMEPRMTFVHPSARVSLPAESLEIPPEPQPRLQMPSAPQSDPQIDTAHLVRIALTVRRSNGAALSSEPIFFDLLDHDTPITLSTAELQTADSWVVTEHGVSFSSRLVTREFQTLIWLESKQIYIKDMARDSATRVNGLRLEQGPNDESLPFKLTRNDVITLGRGYDELDHDTDSSRCITALVNLTHSSKINFRCPAMCQCTWRVLFDRKNIYTLDKQVQNPNQVYEALRTWTQSSSAFKHLQTWIYDDGHLLIEVIEKLSMTEELNALEVSLCEFWIRAIAGIVGILPKLLMLPGVKEYAPGDSMNNTDSNQHPGWSYEGKPVTLKIVRPIITERNRSRIHRELIQAALKLLHHPHVHPFLGVTQDIIPHRLALVSSWLSNGNILQYLERHPEGDRLSLMAQSAHGLQFLHGQSPPVIHGNIRASNVLICNDGSARLTDFGLHFASESRRLTSTEETTDTSWWMAPELLNSDAKRSRKSDVYAFAKTIIEVYSDCTPSTSGYYNVPDLMAVCRRGVQHARTDAPSIQHDFPEELWSLLQLCWHNDIQNRPTSGKVRDELQSLCNQRNSGLQMTSASLDSSLAPEMRSLSRIDFYCQPLCHCSWRKYFDQHNIFPITAVVEGPETIFNALKSWFSQSNSSENPQILNSDFGALVIDVIEKLISAMNATASAQLPVSSDTSRPRKFSLCLSWIRQAARRFNVLPKSIILEGVQQIDRYPAISSGAFADIYEARYNGQLVALKVLRGLETPERTKNMHEEITQEALYWMHLKHDHILPFLGIPQDLTIPHLGLVSPWMSNGNILRYLENNIQADRLSLLRQIASGLSYLHGCDPALIHGDIKAANILVDDDGAARLADFGLLTVSETQGYITTKRRGGGAGTARWMSPELMDWEDSMKKSRSSDIYAFGMTIIEIFSGSPPFSGENYKNDVQICRAVISGERPKRLGLLRHMPDELWKLAQRCWEAEANRRPVVQMVLNELEDLCAQRGEE